nr:zinc ribbon domain-containing protein [Candidatus Freyarchaeota archaeon]
MKEITPGVAVIGPLLIFLGIASLMFSLPNLLFGGGFQLFPLIFFLPFLLFSSYFFGGMGGSLPFIISLILIFYISQTNTFSFTTVLPWIGVALIIAGIAVIIVGSRAEAKARVTIRGRQPVLKETIKEREIGYIRCRYCGAKVSETERKCPECGAKL